MDLSIVYFPEMLVIPEIVVDVTDQEMLLSIDYSYSIRRIGRRKSNSSLINIYFLAKMLSSSSLSYGVHHTTVL